MSTPALAVVPCDVRDLALAERGKRRIEWAFQSMCVLQGIRKHFIKEQPFARYRIAACLHISPEAANLMITLRDGGANLMLCAASPSSTHDEVAACLVKDYGIPVFGICGENHETFVSHIGAVLAHEPQIVIDDGCILTAALHENHEQALAAVIGGTEDTAMGVHDCAWRRAKISSISQWWRWAKQSQNNFLKTVTVPAKAFWTRSCE